MDQVSSNRTAVEKPSSDEALVPVTNQAFGNALRSLKEQKFSVICDIFENNEDGLRELLSNPTPPVEALVARFGELEAEVVSKRLIDLIDAHSAKTQGVDRGDISSFKTQLQSDLGSVLRGFGMDTQRPPYIDRAFTKSVEKAISEYLCDPESQALNGLLQREAKNFFAADDVADFRAIGLGKVEGALRALGEESGRASEVEDGSDQPSFNGSGRLTRRETPETREEFLTDILEVLVAAQAEEKNVKELLKSFPEVIEQLVSDSRLWKTILSENNGVKNPKAVAIVLEALLEQSSCIKERRSLLKTTMPEALRFVGPAGVRSLRADVGFDSIADLRKADECVIDAVVKLEKLTQDPELALYLVNRCLQFPAESFEAKRDTRNDIPIVEFDIEAVQKTVNAMVEILDESSVDARRKIQELMRTDSFKQLPKLYRKAIEDEVRKVQTSSISFKTVLKTQIEADRIGLGAERRAEDILNDLVKEGTINRFSKSLKNSDADRLGLDYAIWLPDGTVIYLDIKSSETGAYHAHQERINFAEQVHMSPFLAFIGEYADPKILFLRSTLVVISPDSTHEANKNRILDAISIATTLPDELSPTHENQALLPWQSMNDGRW